MELLRGNQGFKAAINQGSPLRFHQEKGKRDRGEPPCCVWETEGANLGQTGACTRITRVMNVHVSVRPGLSGLGCACQRVFMN